MACHARPRWVKLRRSSAPAASPSHPPVRPRSPERERRRAAAASRRRHRAPKQAEPEPDMRASRQPSVARRALAAPRRSPARCASAGRFEIVAAARRAMQRPPPSVRAGGGSGAAGCRGCASAVKTSAVETGRPGQTSTSGSAGQPSSGVDLLADPARRGAPARRGTSARRRRASGRSREARPAACRVPKSRSSAVQHGRRIGRAAAEPGAGRDVLLHADRRRRLQARMLRRTPPPRARRDRSVARRMRGEAAR